jgi:crotonobetainyl-CoA:carnitine CoA-transferase CaiB-like acyl-CoA transferase
VLNIDLADDGRFATEYSRFVHRKALAELIQSRFATAARDHWLAVLSDAGIPCGPVNDVAAIINDPQFAERGIFLQDPERYGEPVIVNTPIIADGAPRARDRAPELGEDTASLLAELGYDSARIEQLARAGVVGVAADVTTTA